MLHDMIDNPEMIELRERIWKASAEHLNKSFHDAGIVE